MFMLLSSSPYVDCPRRPARGRSRREAGPCAWHHPQRGFLQIYIRFDEFPNVVNFGQAAVPRRMLSTTVLVSQGLWVSPCWCCITYEVERQVSFQVSQGSGTMTEYLVTWNKCSNTRSSVNKWTLNTVLWLCNHLISEQESHPSGSSRSQCRAATTHSDVWKHILWLWPLQGRDWGLVEPQIYSGLDDCRRKEMLAPSPGIVLSGGSLQFRRIHLPYLSDVSVIGFDNLLSCASDFCRELWYVGSGWFCLPLRE